MQMTVDQRYVIFIMLPEGLKTIEYWSLRQYKLQSLRNIINYS